MRRIVLFLLAVASSGAFAILPPPNGARIQEIAAMLPVKAVAPGCPASDRKSWTRLAALPDAPKVLVAAEAALKVPNPVCDDALYQACLRTGSRKLYETPYFERAMRLNAFVIAEALEYKGRFLPAIIEHATAICDEPGWVIPAHDRKQGAWKGTAMNVDLFASARAWFLAQTLAVLEKELPPALTQRMRNLIRTRVTEPYLACCRHAGPKRDYSLCWWFDGEGNWTAVCHAGCTGTILMLEDDPRVRAEAIEACERALPRYLAKLGADGYCEEGSGYWNYGFGHFLTVGLTVREATGGKVDLLAGDKARICAEYAVNIQMEPGMCPAFADNNAPTADVLKAFCRQIWPDSFPASATRVPLLSAPPGQCHEGRQVAPYRTLALRAFGQAPAPIAGDDVLHLRNWFPSGGVCISRLAPDACCRFAAAVKGGHNNEMHNHDDLGSYYVTLNGENVTGDAGSELYTLRTFSPQRYVSKMLNSYGHPVPFVNGMGQGHNKEAFAAKIVSTDFTDDQDTVVMDLTAAYPAAAKVKSLVRTFTFNRPNRTFTVSDEAVFQEPVPFEDPILTYEDVAFAYEKGGLTLGTNVNVKVEATGGEWSWKTELIDNPPKISPKRLAVRFDKPVTSVQVAFSFSVLPWVK